MLSVATHTYVDRSGKTVVEPLVVRAIDLPTCVCDPGILRQIANLNGSVAVTRDGHLGDLLMLTPSLRLLKQTLPGLRINMYCDLHFQRVFKGNSYVESVSVASARSTKMTTYSVDLRGYVERHPDAQSVDRTTLFGWAFGIEIEDGKADFVVDEEDSEKASKRVSQFSHIDENGRYIVIAPDASDPRRALKETFTADLRNRMLAEGYSVFVTGLTHGTLVELGELGAILRGAKAVVSADNGVYHLSSAVGDTPTFPLFTTIRPSLRCCWYENCYPIVSPISCSPCDEVPIQGCDASCSAAFDAETIFNRVMDKIDG